MRGIPRLVACLLVLGVLGVTGGALPGRAATVPSRTFDAAFDRVWTVTETVLKTLGWEIDQSDPAVGWLLTDSRKVDLKEYAGYGKGLRHKLRISLKRLSASRTLVSVERELYTEERVLWMVERTPVAATEQTVEAVVLAAIAQGL